MFLLEHSAADRLVLHRAAPSLANLQEAQSAWKDDFGLNSRLRRRFRVGHRHKTTKTPKRPPPKAPQRVTATKATKTPLKAPPKAPQGSLT